MLQLGGFQLLSAWLALGSALRTGAPPRVVGSGEPVRVAAGADVVLPCRLEPRSDAEALTVEWTRPDPTPGPRRVEYVLFYRDGREVPDLKLAAYARRAALLPERLKHGDLSLSLRRVTPADQGSYRCSVPTLRGPGTAATVQLLVGETQSEETTAPPRTLPDPEEHRETEVTGGRLHGGALVPVGVGLLLLLVAGVGVCLHKRNHGNPAVRTSRLLQPA